MIKLLSFDHREVSSVAAIQNHRANKKAKKVRKAQRKARRLNRKEY